MLLGLLLSSRLWGNAPGRVQGTKYPVPGDDQAGVARESQPAQNPSLRPLVLPALRQSLSYPQRTTTFPPETPPAHLSRESLRAAPLLMTPSRATPTALPASSRGRINRPAFDHRRLPLVRVTSARFMLMLSHARHLILLACSHPTLTCSIATMVRSSSR